MIEIFEGRIGGGKTYTAVERMAEVFSRGGTVATNVEIKWEGMKKLVESRYKVIPQERQWIDMRGKDMTLFHRYTPQGTRDNKVLVVIDEAHLHFNSRDWAKTEKETLAFLTQSRKQYTDIVFISQSATNIDKQFRVLNQFIWRFKDLETWRIPVLFIRYPLLCQILTLGFSEGKHILQLQFDYDGATLVKRDFVSKSQLVYDAYDTNALVRDFPRDGVVEKIALDKALTPWQKIMQKIKAQPQNAGFGSVKVMFGVLIVITLAITGMIWAFKRTKEKIGDPLGGTSQPSKAFTDGQPMPPPRTVVSTTQPMQPTQPQVAKVAPAYDVYQERFVAYYGRGILKTDKGEYQAGEMSNKGFVLATSDRRAKLNSPDGRTAWVVADDLNHAQGDASAVGIDREGKEPKERPKLNKPYDPEDEIQERWKKLPPSKSVKETLAGLTPLEKARGGYPTEETLNRMAGVESTAQQSHNSAPKTETVRIDPTRKYMTKKPVGLIDGENSSLTSPENVLQ